MGQTTVPFSSSRVWFTPCICSAMVPHYIALLGGKSGFEMPCTCNLNFVAIEELPQCPLCTMPTDAHLLLFIFSLVHGWPHMIPAKCHANAVKSQRHRQCPGALTLEAGRSQCRFQKNGQAIPARPFLYFPSSEHTTSKTHRGRKLWSLACS